MGKSSAVAQMAAHNIAQIKQWKDMVGQFCGGGGAEREARVNLCGHESI